MLKHRVLTALLLAPLAIYGVLNLPTAWFAFALGLVFLIGVREWARLSGVQNVSVRFSIVVLFALFMFFIWRTPQWISPRAAITFGVCGWILALFWLRHFEFAANPSRKNILLKLMVGFWVVIPAWCAAIWIHAQNKSGPLSVLYVFILIWVADSFAYFVGRQFGKTKLAPRVSPGKTREGIYGALFGSALFALAAGYFWGQSNRMLAAFVALSLITVLASVIGDLFESMLKRHANIKDSSNLLPGHGGILDRFDSLFAALPIFALGKMVFNL